ncbi:T9SS type A sorting domain-containing protein, partial [Flammeovirga sp. OC4]|uniref:T9SS type A sorting domain-containing protein n=1 Tax=Flammeovirga sp. OC4 TaxID=1382345 RepID=UPI0005C57107
EETTTKTFDVTVIAAEKTIAELLQEASDALMITYAEGDNAESVTSSLTLPLTSSHASTVAWSSSNEAVISSDGTVTRPSATTTVTLTATLSLEEETVTKLFEVVVLKEEVPTSVEDGLLILNIYPNPTVDHLMVSTPQMDADIAVFDLLGKSIDNFTIEKTANGYKLNVQSLPNGKYILKVNTQSKLFIKK